MFKKVAIALVLTGGLMDGLSGSAYGNTEKFIPSGQLAVLEAVNAVYNGLGALATGFCAIPALIGTAVSYAAVGASVGLSLHSMNKSSRAAGRADLEKLSNQKIGGRIYKHDKDSAQSRNVGIGYATVAGATLTLVGVPAPVSVMAMTVLGGLSSNKARLDTLSDEQTSAQNNDLRYSANMKWLPLKHALYSGAATAVGALACLGCMKLAGRMAG